MYDSNTSQNRRRLTGGAQKTVKGDLKAIAGWEQDAPKNAVCQNVWPNHSILKTAMRAYAHHRLLRAAGNSVMATSQGDNLWPHDEVRNNENKLASLHDMPHQQNLHQ